MEEGRTEGASKFTVAWAGPCAGLGVTLGFRSVSLALMAATRPGTTLFSPSRPAGHSPSPSSPLILLPPSFLRFASFVLLPFLALSRGVSSPLLSSPRSSPLRVPLSRWLFYLFILLGRRPLFVPRRAGWLAARSVGR